LTDICSLLFELASQDRLEILRQLDEEPMVVTKLSKKLELAVQETSRHLSRLRKIGLAERDLEGLNHISRYGKLVLQLLPALEFVHRYRDYFSTHSIDRLPSSFLQRFGDLRKSALGEDIMTGFLQVDKLLGEAQEYVLSMTDQYLVSHAPLIEEALERGVLTKNIDAPYSLPPQDLPEEWRRQSFIETLHRTRAEGPLEERFLERFDVYLYMSEAEVATVAFPMTNGKFDYIGFSSRDEDVRLWCKELFEYYWERSTPRDEFIEDFQRWIVNTPGAGDALRDFGEGRGKEVDDGIRSTFEEKGLFKEDKLTFIGIVMYRRLLQ
jgi:predicted transcriptional regulator